MSVYLLCNGLCIRCLYFLFVILLYVLCICSRVCFWRYVVNVVFLLYAKCMCACFLRDDCVSSVLYSCSDVRLHLSYLLYVLV